MVVKCCYFVPLDVGALLLGVITLILSIILGIYSIVLLGLENSSPPLGAVHLKLMMHLELDSSAVKIILSIIITAKILWMIFSIILIVGMRKNRPSYLLCYFSFGVVMVILMMLCSLLVLLQRHWILSLIYMVAAILYMHGLIVVHHTYELMQNGQIFMERCEDEEHLWNPEEEGQVEPVAL